VLSSQIWLKTTDVTSTSSPYGMHADLRGHTAQS
jgi:hypothetical protein